MGQGRVQGKQLKDNTIDSTEIKGKAIKGEHIDDNSILPISLTAEAKQAALKLKAVPQPYYFNFTITESGNPVFDFPLSNVDFTTTLQQLPNQTLLYVDNRSILRAVATGSVLDTKLNLMFSNRVASTISSAPYNLEIVFISAAHTLENYNLIFDPVGKRVRWANNFVWYNITHGYNIIYGLDPAQFIVLKVATVSGSLNTDQTYNITVSPGKKVLITEELDLGNLDQGNYTGIYPQITNLYDMESLNFYSKATKESVVNQLNLIADRNYTVSIDNVNVNPKTISLTFPLNLPVNVTESQAPAYIKLFVNGELIPKEFFTYSITNNRITWNSTNAEYDLSSTDKILIQTLDIL